MQTFRAISLREISFLKSVDLYGLEMSKCFEIMRLGILTFLRPGLWRVSWSREVEDAKNL